MLRLLYRSMGAETHRWDGLRIGDGASDCGEVPPRQLTVKVLVLVLHAQELLESLQLQGLGVVGFTLKPKPLNLWSLNPKRATKVP